MRESVVIREEKEMDWKKKKKKMFVDGEGEEETKPSLALTSSSASSDMISWEKYGMVLRVLLVEADDSTRQIISALLRKCSYRVAAVPDGLMAWETLKGKPRNIDLVLTEVELPSISGYALLTLVMEHDACKNIPVVMMSSQYSINTVLKCILKGAADFLIKPIRKNELRNLWQHVWRRQSLNDGLSHHSPVMLEKVEATSENHVPSNHSITGAISPKEKLQELPSDNTSADEKHKLKEIVKESYLNGEKVTSAHNESWGKKTQGDQMHVLNHSNASAFSWYSTKIVHPCPPTSVKVISADDEEDIPESHAKPFVHQSGGPHVSGKETATCRIPSCQISLSSLSNARHADQEQRLAAEKGKLSDGSVITEKSCNCNSSSYTNDVNSLLVESPSNSKTPEDGVANAGMSLREAALMKFRQKRKDRCFEKKVRYQSRKRLAEQRPRVKGQFVRQVSTDEGLKL